MANILIEIAAIVPATGLTQTLRMSSRASKSAGVELDGKRWIPAITKAPTFSLTRWDDGQPTPLDSSYGAITFATTDVFANRDWSKYAFEGSLATVWYGQAGDPFTAYRLMWSGVLGPLERKNDQEASFSLLGPEANLQRPLLSASYQGTGNAEGPASLQGTLKPMVFGAATNVEPILVDSQRFIYQYHGYGSCAVSAIYSNALTLNAPNFTTTTYAGLRDYNLLPGQWMKCEALGMFRIGADPGSVKITADVGTATTVGTAVTAMLTAVGVPAVKIDTTVGTVTTGYSNYITAQTMAFDAIREAAAAANTYLISDSVGEFYLSPHDSTKSVGILASNRRSRPLVLPDTIVEVKNSSPPWRVKVGHTRVFAVHSISEISPAVANLAEQLAANAAAIQATSDLANSAATDAVFARARVTNQASDGVLDRTEKLQRTAELSVLTAEQPGIRSEAIGRSLSVTDFDQAWTALNNYIATLALGSLNVDTPLVAATDVAKYTDYYNARAALRLAISTSVNGGIQVANSTATNANTVAVYANTVAVAANSTANAANSTATIVRQAINNPIDNTVYPISAIVSNVATLQQTVPPLATAQNAAANAVAANTAAQIVLVNVTAANAAVQSARSAATNAAAQAAASVVTAQAAVTSSQAQASAALGWAQAAYANAIAAATSSVSANAANAAAWTATGYANSASTAAGTSATLANTIAGYVRANATNALNYSITALTASDTANSAASNALQASVLASTASVGANIIAASLFPDKYDGVGQYFTGSFIGSPTTVADLPSNTTSTDGVMVWQRSFDSQSVDDFATRSVEPVVANRTYTIEVECQQVASTGSNGQVQIYARCLNSTYTATGNISSTNYNLDGSIQTFTYQFTSNDLPVGSVWFRPTVRLKNANGTATIQIRRLSLKDVTESVKAKASADAALASQNLASSYADNASQSASLSLTYSGYARSNASLAQTYSNTAIFASNSANAAAANATTAQGLAVSAAGNAAASAGTASNAAIYANSNAINASASAGTAKQQADYAATNTAQALNYSKIALQASNTANDAASSAQSSSVLAANASITANVITSMLIPDRYDMNGGQYFTNNPEGAPTSVADLPYNNVITFGPVRDLTVAAGQNAQIATRGVIPQVDGRIYRLEVEYSIIANGGANDRLVYGLRQLDGSYVETVTAMAGVDGPFTGNTKIASALFSDVAYNSSITLIDSAAFWLRPFIRVFGTTGSTGTTIRFRRLTLTDYTEAFQAGVSASAAFTSNQYASANASAAAQNASTASDQASYAATNASQALSYSRTAQNASNTANAASASANAAQGIAASASNTANAAAGQAQTQAVYASTNATTATTQANSAKTSADYAVANAASARGYSNSALSASNSAQAASVTANSAMGTALQASNSANTAAGQAQTFSGYANQNAVSAAANSGAAAQSALYAATNAAQANSFATTAITASQTANSAMTAAQTAQGIAVSSNNQTVIMIAQEMPDRFLGSAAGFYRPTGVQQYTGDPSTRTMDAVGYALITQDSTWGSAYLFPTTGTALLATQGVVAATPGRVYEITVEVNLSQYSGTPTNLQVWLDCMAADYSAIGSIAKSVALPTYTTPFRLVWRVSDTAPSALGSGADYLIPGSSWDTGSAYLRVMVGSNPGFGGSSVFMRRLSVRDITSQYNGEGSAAAAALSASYAYSNSTTAAQQAGAASQSSLTANTAAGYSSANAGISQTWAAAAQSNASGAAGSAAAAATSATVAASVSLGAINANPVFADYPSASALPTGWTVEATGTSSIQRVAGLNGIGYSFRMSAAANVDAYTAFQTAAGTIAVNGWYVIEADVTLQSGRLAGGGVLFRALNSDSSQAYDHQLVFSTEPDVTGAVIGNGVAGQTYFWRKLVRVVLPTASKSNLYAMAHWAGLAGTTTGFTANIIFRRVSVRPASPGEIEARAATLTIPTLQANVTTVQGALATVDGRTRAYWQTTVNAGANTTAFISAQTVNTAGNSSSTIGMGASELHIYNPVQNGWKKALSIQGGNAVFSGGLQAGAYIRLGSGQGWPVALQSQDYNVGDGEVVNFGVDLGKVPALSFAGNNLQPLASGETYQLYADNLTSTGFTARLKKSAPGNYGSYDLTNAQQLGGSNPTYTIDLGSNPEANDGNYSYTFSVSVTQEATDYYQDTGTQ